jgi:UDP-2,3-diacylglucosamine pyrophosphatase LpxH
MALYPPAFAELYVVSDIHMGGHIDGDQSFQIFNRGPRLAALVRHIAQIRPNEDVALVLNGDIFDSLAERDLNGYAALSAGSAETMLRRICTDPSFSDVWLALSKFVGTPRRYLIFVVGNHDIELALPVVENWIRERLGAGNSEAQARMGFATHGGGFACRVGKAQVFCTHGNEVDDWNVVNHTKLGELGNAINAGRVVDGSRWEPNSGTRLVVDVMNFVKETYPFVDLLKPETAAIASVLFAIDQDTFKRLDIESAYPILKDKIKGGFVVSNLLYAQPNASANASPSAAADEAMDQLLGANLRAAVRAGQTRSNLSSEDYLLKRANPALRTRADTAAGVARTDATRTLGIREVAATAWELLVSRLGAVSKQEACRSALMDWLSDDDTFDVNSPTGDGGLYDHMQDRIGGSIDFVITGHTHLPRALPLRRGHGYFYNSGTWIRSLRLTPQSLGKDAFETRVWPVLTANSMTALDKARIPGPGGTEVCLVLDHTNAVRISSQNAGVVGDLLRVEDGPENSVKLPSEENTKSFKIG